MDSHGAEHARGAKKRCVSDGGVSRAAEASCRDERQGAEAAHGSAKPAASAASVAHRAASRVVSRTASRLYVVQVMGGAEERTRRLVLRTIGDVVDDCFTPLYEAKRAERGQWRTVRKQLLPGYVFIQTSCPDEAALKLKSVPAFTRLLGSNGERFMPLAPDEVAWLNAFTDVETHVVQMSEGFIEGDRVLVTRGPLKGHELEIKRIDRHKREAELEVPILGRTKRIKVGLEIVSKR